MGTFERQGTGEKGPYRAAAPPVAALVERDARDPDPEWPVGVVAAERRKSCDKGFLRQIHRLVRIPNIVPNQSKDRRFVAPQKFAMSQLLSSLGKSGEFAVATLRKVETHRASAVNAWTTLLSNISA